MALTPLSEALERILATVEIKPDWEMVALEAAPSRYCAETIDATLSVPPADNSAYQFLSQGVPALKHVVGELEHQQPAPNSQEIWSMMSLITLSSE